jgi:hypothetical protein
MVEACVEGEHLYSHNTNIKFISKPKLITKADMDFCLQKGEWVKKEVL